MPIYTYRCYDCENEFEKRQRMSEDPLTVCPTCEGRIRRVVKSVGVVFKGSGFYVTDNRNGNSGKSSKKESGKAKTSADTKDKKENKKKSESKATAKKEA